MNIQTRFDLGDVIRHRNFADQAGYIYRIRYSVLMEYANSPDIEYLVKPVGAEWDRAYTISERDAITLDEAAATAAGCPE